MDKRAVVIVTLGLYISVCTAGRLAQIPKNGVSKKGSHHRLRSNSDGADGANAEGKPEPHADMNKDTEITREPNKEDAKQRDNSSEIINHSVVNEIQEAEPTPNQEIGIPELPNEPEHGTVDVNVDDKHQELANEPEQGIVDDIVDNKHPELPDEPELGVNEKYGQLEETKKRQLMSGDTFTPYEMLPITTRLLRKVENPHGKGIVSSAKSPEALADTLFEAFFVGPKRIVVLNDKDIVSLDALQALALSGEVANALTIKEGISNRQKKLLNHNDQIVEIDNGTKYSKYLLLSKDISTPDQILRRKDKMHKLRTSDKKQRKLSADKRNHMGHRNTKNPLRKGNKVNKSIISHKKNNNKSVKTAKQSHKSGNGVRNGRNKNSNIKIRVSAHKVNPGKKHTVKVKKRLNIKRTSNIENKKKNVATIRPLLKGLTESFPSKGTTSKASACRWRYICKNPSQIDTCQLQTECTKNTRKHNFAQYIGPKLNNKMSADLRQFRKMLDISQVDEEVEKILELHILSRKTPFGFGNSKNIERIETLAEFFNNIIMSETTTAVYSKYNDNNNNGEDVDPDNGNLDNQGDGKDGDNNQDNGHNGDNHQDGNHNGQENEDKNQGDGYDGDNNQEIGHNVDNHQDGGHYGQENDDQNTPAQETMHESPINRRILGVPTFPTTNKPPFKKL